MGLFSKKVSSKFLEEHKVPSSKEYLLNVGAIYTDFNNHENSAFVLADPRKGKGGKYLLPMYGVTNKNTLTSFVSNIIDTKGAQKNYSDKLLSDAYKHANKLIPKFENALKSSVINPVTESEVNSVTNVSAYYLDIAGHFIRNGFTLGYLSEEEAYTWLEHIFEVIKENFSSWKEYGISLCIGRETSDQGFMDPYAKSFVRLLNNNDFYFVKYPLK